MIILAAVFFKVALSLQLDFFLMFCWLLFMVGFFATSVNASIVLTLYACTVAKDILGSRCSF